MKREELARTLARETHQSSAAARDQIDELVRGILKALRAGHPVVLPGIGKLVSGARLAPQPAGGVQRKES